MSGAQRKLASVQKIESITPIPNSDKLELAKVLGWVAVVGKGEYKAGDEIVYFEIDSFIPETRSEFEFLRARCYKEYPDGRKGFKIKTIRLRGQISQGLVMPLNILPRAKYTIGQDVSQLMGVVKWEPPMPKCLSGIAKGTFPSFILKTDETRVQLLQAVLNRHVGIDCYITEKIDGSSVTYYLYNDIFGVCSRNLDLKLDDEDNVKSNSMIKWAIANDVEKKLRDFVVTHPAMKNIAIQGEIYGKDLNGNSLICHNQDVRFFNVFDIDYCRYFDFDSFVSAITDMGLQTVPILNTEFKLINNIDELVKLSTGKSIINPKVWREGIVIRPLKETLDLGMSSYNFTTARLSFKVVNPEYLIENENA